MLTQNQATEWPQLITQRQIALDTGLQLSQVWRALDTLRFKEYIVVIKWGRADLIAVIKDYTKSHKPHPKKYL